MSHPTPLCRAVQKLTEQLSSSLQSMDVGSSFIDALGELEAAVKKAKLQASWTLLREKIPGLTKVSWTGDHAYSVDEKRYVDIYRIEFYCERQLLFSMSSPDNVDLHGGNGYDDDFLADLLNIPMVDRQDGGHLEDQLGERADEIDEQLVGVYDAAHRLIHDDFWMRHGDGEPNGSLSVPDKATSEPAGQDAGPTL